MENGWLVGYAGKYLGNDGQEHAYVGRVYLNFAVLEEWPSDDLDFIAGDLTKKLKMELEKVMPWDRLSPNIVLCGAPIGGYCLSTVVGQKLGCRTVKAEKKVLAVGAEGQRDETKLILDRHEIHPGDLVIIIEDVCNNFSTTRQLIELIESYGGIVIAIACFLNRSPDFDAWYPCNERKIPVVALVRKEIKEFRQDDPAVADQVKRGEVYWKPKRKEQWAALMASMAYA
jgi:adenine/guanine phosphoribosyltransferase-like PRPP-binding protein